MRDESAKLWGEFLGGHSRIHVYTVDPGAHAIAVELVPLVASMGLLAGWVAEGWSAQRVPDCWPLSALSKSLGSGDTLILGSQVNFERTQTVLRDALSAGVRTVFVFDHWKNFKKHFGDGPLPDIIVVPDETGRQLLLAEIGAAPRVQILPHLALQAAEDRVRAYGASSAGVIAVLLDPTERSDNLGYDWRSTLDAVADFASTRTEIKLLVKPHPRQDAEQVENWLNRWKERGLSYELFRGETERLIAAAEEVWGMTTIALNVALAAGKPIRSFQIGRDENGRRASNPHIEPFVLTEQRRSS